MKKIFFLLLMSSWTYGHTSFLNLVSPLEDNSKAGTKVQFSIGYTLGTHHGNVQDMQGHLNLDEDNLQNLRGEFSLAINQIKTGNEMRDCHLQESLGLDYKIANFPAEHVCSEDNTLPLTGGNRVVYPFIQFKIEQVAYQKGDLNSDSGAELQVQGIWSIHGKDIRQTHTVRLKKSANGIYHLVGLSTFPLSLQDFGIIVKNAKKGPLTIKAYNTVHVNLQLSFRK